jgi:2-hydroxychromene-2-carboxylate isomerase
VKRAPRIYFSFRSPFSWMAVHRLQTEVPDVMRRLEFVPYWDPDATTGQALADAGAHLPYTQMSRAKHLYILQDTKRNAARLGLSMAWPIDVEPWWELPHLAWLRARQLGAEREFYAAVVAARWERGEDVCQRDAVHAIAESVGLDGAELAAAPENPALREEGVAALVDAYEDDVFGIPYFRVGRHRFWGLDRVDGFLEQWLPCSTAAEPDGLAGVPERVRAAVGAYDHDTAGGCG